MSEDTDVIAAFVTGIGTQFYFEQYRDAATRTADFAQLRADLIPVRELSRGNINRNSDDDMLVLDGVLDVLNQYNAASDAAARQALADRAIAESEAALTAIMDLIRDDITNDIGELDDDGPSPNSAAYAFGILHYAILVRQAVADVVQDGPYGAPGLLPSLTAASRLLYNDINAPGDEINVYTALLNAIAQQIEVPNSSVEGTNADDLVSFNVVSDFGGFGFRVEVPRLDGETDEDFSDRIAEVTVQVLDDAFRQEQENISSGNIRNIGQQVAQYVSADEDVAAAVHERIGDDGNTIEDGTELADYFSGLGGDDVYNGQGGPDALNGGDGNDILRGGAFQDVLVGGAGNDVMFGNTTRADTADGDVARFAGLTGEHTILGGNEYAVVIGPDGSRDKLFDVSYLRFDDGDVTLPDGNALATTDVPFATLNKENFDIGERVALLYEAALNRNGAIDLPGLNFYIDVTARDNLSNEFLAADLMTSPEFTANFGDANTLSNQAFLEQIYLNVLDRPSDAAGLQFYLDLLNSGGISKALALADIAVSPENTNGSAEILQSLYETTTPEVDPEFNIPLDWSFIA